MYYLSVTVFEGIMIKKNHVVNSKEYVWVNSELIDKHNEINSMLWNQSEISKLYNENSESTKQTGSLLITLLTDLNKF